MIAPTASIVIPTRNRPSFARLAVESAIEGTGADVQIIVADNGDRPVVFGPLPPRVVLLRPERRVLAMSDNWERGLAAATGEWLVYMGDKHRLVPGAIDALLKLTSGTQAVTYYRPMLQQSLDAHQVDDLLEMRSAPGKLYDFDMPFRSRVLPGERILREWFLAPGYRPDLPMFYNTLVHRDVVQLVVRQFGRFFDSVSPDVSSSLVFGSQLESYRETSLPAVVQHWPNSDFGRWSTGASSMQAGVVNAKFLQELGDDPIARDGFPPGFTSCMMFEYRHFLRKWPAYRNAFPLPWRIFVEAAINEAFRTRPRNERLSLIGQILQVSQSEGRDLTALVGGAVEISKRFAGRARTHLLGPRVPPSDRRSFTSVDGLLGAFALLAKKLGEPFTPAAVKGYGIQAAASLS
jgi:hypothetical protein